MSVPYLECILFCHSSRNVKWRACQWLAGFFGELLHVISGILDGKNLHAAWHRWHDIHRYRGRRSTGVWQYVTGSTRDLKSDLVCCVQRLTSLTGLLHVVYYDKMKDEHLLLYKIILDKCRFLSSAGL